MSQHFSSVKFNHAQDYSEGVFLISSKWITMSDLTSMSQIICYDYWANVDADGPGVNDWMIDEFRVDGNALTLRIEPSVICGSHTETT